MRFALRDFMAAMAVGAVVTTWSVHNDPARFPLIAAAVISLAVVFRTAARRPRAGVGRWVVTGAAAAVLLAGARIGGAWGLELKEELRARQGLVAQQAGIVKSLDARIVSLQQRIPESEGSETRNPRHDRWVKELAKVRSRGGLVRRKLATYRRLATRPWEAFPGGGGERVYLETSERAYLNRQSTPGARCFGLAAARRRSRPLGWRWSCPLYWPRVASRFEGRGTARSEALVRTSTSLGLSINSVGLSRRSIFSSGRTEAESTSKEGDSDVQGDRKR
jgi:hypothetical protein